VRETILIRTKVGFGQYVEPLFDGMSPLFNIFYQQGNYAIYTDQVGGVSADMGSAISGQTGLSAEFWINPLPMKINSTLWEFGPTFYLGNANSYIHFSSYNGTPSLPTSFVSCFDLNVVINGVSVGTVGGNVAKFDF
jgi:hypothetical protein